MEKGNGNGTATKHNVRVAQGAILGETRRRRNIKNMSPNATKEEGNGDHQRLLASLMHKKCGTGTCTDRGWHTSQPETKSEAMNASGNHQATAQGNVRISQGVTLTEVKAMDTLRMARATLGRTRVTHNGNPVTGTMQTNGEILDHHG